jgi:hypothetical protein
MRLLKTTKYPKLLFCRDLHPSPTRIQIQETLPCELTIAVYASGEIVQGCEFGAQIISWQLIIRPKADRCSLNKGLSFKAVSLELR